MRASRADDKTVGDWIINAVEAYMLQQMTDVAIPQELDFSDLRLARDQDGAVSFDWAVIERICRANNLPLELLREGPEDNVSSLIVGWYQAHRQHDGAPDPVAEDLIAEVLAEESAGQAVSHQPGRA